MRMQEATTPSELATTPSAAPSPSDSRLRLYSTVLDYSWMISVGLVLSLLFGSHGRTLSNTSTTLGLVQALAVLGASSVGALYARERVYFRLFRDRIPAIKRQPLSRETQFHLLQTGAISMLSFGLLFKCSAVYWTPFAPRSPRFWCSIVLPFYAILALRDVLLLLPLHTLMHKGGPRFWRLRKSPSPHPGEPFSSRDARSIDAISDSLSRSLFLFHLLADRFHHEVQRNAQSLHAFHLDAFDLLVENVGAPFLLLGAQYCAQRLFPSAHAVASSSSPSVQVGLHWLTGLLLTFHDGGLHSINPFSVMYFNPLLDRFLEPNVMHQLHHAVVQGYYLFVPWHHLLPGRRRADCDRYNRVFNTDFDFR